MAIGTAESHAIAEAIAERVEARLRGCRSEMRSLEIARADIDMTVEEGAKGLERALTQLCRRASLAIQSGYSLLILSDRGVDEDPERSEHSRRGRGCRVRRRG